MKLIILKTHKILKSYWTRLIMTGLNWSNLFRRRRTIKSLSLPQKWMRPRKKYKTVKETTIKSTTITIPKNMARPRSSSSQMTTTTSITIASQTTAVASILILRRNWMWKTNLQIILWVKILICKHQIKIQNRQVNHLRRHKKAVVKAHLNSKPTLKTLET